MTILILILGTSSSSEENSKVLGDYVAIGTQNGRYLYQQKDEDRFLEYEDRNWIVSTGVIQSNPIQSNDHHLISARSARAVGI